MAVPPGKKQVTKLSDMVYDEVSLVGTPANQESDIVLFKGERMKMCKCGSGMKKGADGRCANCGGMISKDTNVSRRDARGAIALARARTTLAKMSPTASDVHEESVMGAKRKKKQKKDRKRYEVVATSTEVE